MDDTQQSRVSDAAAAATRKRRSSILKSQRPARTPFSELEFNVATPTDTAKSRRVSFSRRTGVAEFVTNEATTTWKNFYEEHNKSLESSNNESEANASRQHVGHLGKRIFDQQFEEVEAVDFMSGLANGSLNNVNFSQQLASLECTADGKLTAPQNKFELSAFTEQSKLFGNDFTAPSIGDNSGRIDVNFSAIQQFEKDDLDEIEKDLERGPSNIGSHGLFGAGQNMSEYIEVDLNMTHVVKNDEDMSITDTVHSPVQDVSKSASIDKKASLNNDWATDKENIAINPYAAPCETNFAINEEPDQVLVFDGKRLTLQPDIPEKDKNYRQTLLPNSSTETPQRKTIVLNVNDDLPNFIDDNNMLSSKYENSGFKENLETTNKRKTIVFNNDEDNISMTQALSSNVLDDKASERKTFVFDDDACNVSYTQALPSNIMLPDKKTQEKRRTIIYENDAGNISVTQALPTNVITSKIETNPERRRTVIYEDNTGNISVTQALPSNIIMEKFQLDNTKINKEAEDVPTNQSLPTNISAKDNATSKRRTIVFANDTGDISITQAIPTQLIPGYSEEKPINDLNASRKLEQQETRNKQITTIFYDNDEVDISMTQAVSSNILDDKASERKTFVFDDDACNVSYTQALPSNIMLPDKKTQEKRRTIIYENDAGNISVTQALPTNVIMSKIETNPERRRTVIYEDNTGNISVTQALPSNIIMEKVKLDDTKNSNEIEDVLTNQSLPTNIPAKDNETTKRKTIVFANDAGDISITQAIPTQLIPGYSEEEPIDDLDTSRKPEQPEPRNKQITTIVYDNDDVDISMTEAVSANILEQATNERNVIVYDKNEVDISMTEAISANIMEQATNERKTIVYDEDVANISMTLAISANDDLLDKLDSTVDIEKPEEIEDVNVKVTDYEDANNFVSEMSMTTAIPTVQKLLEAGNRETLLLDSHNYDISIVKPADFVSETKLDVAAQTQAARRQSNIAVIQASTEAYDSKVELPMKQRSTSSHVAPDKVQVKLMASTTDQDIEKIIDVSDEAIIQNEEEEKASLITTSDPMMDCQDDKSLMAVLESNYSSGDKLMYAADQKSTESMISITKDCEAVMQTDKNEDSDSEAKIAKPKNKEDVLEEVAYSQSKQAEFNIYESQNPNLSNKLLNVSETDQHARRLSFTSNRANDTQHLLDMISDFTGNADSDEDVKLVDVKVKNQSETAQNTAHNRLSVAPARHSIALSREDLLHNISMAQAILQKSRLALDDSDSADEDTRDASVDLSKNSGRTSYEVVKTLNFDDESINDTSLKVEEENAMPKKIVFDETEDRKESIGKLSPTYLKDVSDGFKELTLDLVKPVSDNMPLQSAEHERGALENMPTHSTQVQVNLTASSQIDIDNHLISNTGAGWDKISSSASGTLDKPEESKSLSVKFAYMDEDREMPEDIHTSSNHHFDTQSTAHIEQPPPSEKIYVCQSDEQHCQRDDQSMIETTTSGRTCVNQSVDATLKHLRDDGVNTQIATRENKELRQTSSSLTLVDDLSKGENSKMTGNNEDYSNHRIQLSRSPVYVEGQAAEVNNKTELSEISLRDSVDNSCLNACATKGKKRIYSPSTHKHKHDASSKEVTPKPMTKMQKISRSPNPQKEAAKMSSRNDSTLNTQNKNSQNVHKPMIAEQKSPKAKNTKSEPTITVQQLITDFKNKNISEKKLDDLNLNPKSETISASFTSSKNMNTMKEEHSTGMSTCFQTPHEAPVQGVPSQMNHPEPLGTSSTSQSEPDSGVNVVAKIDMLPFMGSHECEWDSKSLADTWSFRLQHGRLRLTVQLAHRHDNATRTRVRGDTSVLDIAVETVQQDSKNPVATLSVRFACDTMRYIVSHALRKPCCARDIPQLLRRCAAVARVSLRWGRAMHDAKLQLAYSLENNGNLSLKVANVQLRSIWEVTMHIDLVVDDNGSVPWPKADSVRVTRVVSDLLVPDEDVRRVLSNIPRDWGHAPRTIWRIFRYLKHKTRDDNAILA